VSQSRQARGAVRRLLSVALILVVCGCDRHTSTGSTPSALTIRGRALDFRTNAGVPGAVIEFAARFQSGGGRASSGVTGLYVMSLPGPGFYDITADGARVGWTLVNETGYRGDVLVRGGPCVSRYGSLFDAGTLLPVAGATVAIFEDTTLSGADGWYRLDLGCPAEGTIGFNTTFMSVTHPSYAPLQQVVGRGVRGVERIDLELERR
jgi:hypothetical protein